MVRVKRRYIVLAIEYERNRRQPQDAFLRHVRDRVGELFGDFGLASIRRGFSVKQYDQNDGIMILTVKKGPHDMVMATFPTITAIDGCQCNVRTIHLSATIRGCLKVMKKLYLMNLRASIAKKMSTNQESKIKDGKTLEGEQS